MVSQGAGLIGLLKNDVLDGENHSDDYSTAQKSTPIMLTNCRLEHYTCENVVQGL